MGRCHVGVFVRLYFDLDLHAKDLAEFLTAWLLRSVIVAVCATYSISARSSWDGGPCGHQRHERCVCVGTRDSAPWLCRAIFHCIDSRSDFEVALSVCLATRVERLSKNSFWSRPLAEQCLVLPVLDGFGSAQPCLRRLLTVAGTHERCHDGAWWLES